MPCNMYGDSPPSDPDVGRLRREVEDLKRQVGKRLPPLPPREPTVEDVHRELSEVSAILCGVMSIMEQAGTIEGLLQQFDEGRAGVTRAQAMDWFRRHKEQDALRSK